MRMTGGTWAWVALLAGYATLGAAADVSLVGNGSIAGNATDQSGLTGLLPDGVTPEPRGRARVGDHLRRRRQPLPRNAGPMSWTWA